MDMYDRIQRQPARRQHITPGAAVLAAFGFLVAATCVGMLVYAARYQLRYRRFINDFSASLAASNKMSLRMTWQDKDVPITTDQASRLCRRITTAGSVFVGDYAPESAGDYASGTNHTLPTGGCARAYSGVNIDSFLRRITYQELTREGLRALAPTVVAMARAEGLDAHAEAVRIRLEGGVR